MANQIPIQSIDIKPNTNTIVKHRVEYQQSEHPVPSSEGPQFCNSSCICGAALSRTGVEEGGKGLFSIEYVFISVNSIRGGGVAYMLAAQTIVWKA